MFFHHLHKKIFSLLLILCLTIPANAAVSVSDGSAFVSKAEAASEISELADRMSQLENSLDAKIDSLVSSYLTRNGIWNGETQSRRVANLNNVFGFNYSGSNSNYFYFMRNGIDSWTKYSSRAGSSGKTGYGYASTSSGTNIQLLSYGSSTLVSNITKSGLIKIDYYFTCGDTELDWLQTSPYGCGLAVSFNWYFYQTSTSNVLFRDLVSFSAPLSVISDSDGESNAYLPPSIYRTSFFFVEKDKPLYIYFSTTGNTYSVACRTQKNNKYTFYFTSASVY